MRYQCQFEGAKQTLNSGKTPPVVVEAIVVPITGAGVDFHAGLKI